MGERRKRRLIDLSLPLMNHSMEPAAFEKVPENILATLDHLERRYGSVAGYLGEHGVAGAQLDAVRDRLREPSTEQGDA